MYMIRNPIIFRNKIFLSTDHMKQKLRKKKENNASQSLIYTFLLLFLLQSNHRIRLRQLCKKLLYVKKNEKKNFI